MGNPPLQEFVKEMTDNGGLEPPLVVEITTFEHGDTLDIPGRPTVIHTPGHSPGHSALAFESHRLLIAGDALCTYNIATGRSGPQIASAAFNVSSAQALASLDRLRGIPGTVVFGHGDAWTDGIDTAVDAARTAGTS